MEQGHGVKHLPHKGEVSYMMRKQSYQLCLMWLKDGLCMLTDPERQLSSCGRSGNSSTPQAESFLKRLHTVRCLCHQYQGFTLHAFKMASTCRRVAYP